MNESQTPVPEAARSGPSSEPPRADGLPPAVRRLAGPARAVALAAIWLVVAVLVSLGGAGIVAGVGGAPGSSARPELTWRGDDAITPGLAASTKDLGTLVSEVDGLAATARGAITALIATDRSLLSASVDGGTKQLIAIEATTEALRSRLMALPGVDPAVPGGLAPATELTLGSEARARFSALLAALDATAGLPGDWAHVTSGSLAADALTTLLLDHDTSTARAAVQGRGGDYAGALRTLGQSDSIMARSRALRDQLAPTTDVTTLTAWLDRNAAYDKALRTLYVALESSRGIVTPAVRAAFAAEQAARTALPPDTRAVVVILDDVARGGLNQAAIEIETARGRLDAALAALERRTSTPGD